MKKIVCSILILITVGSAGFSDGYISVETSGNLGLSDPFAFSPDARLAFGFNIFSPLSQEWSFFFSGDESMNYRPIDSHFRYVYTNDLSVSLRLGDFFFKTGLHASGKQSYAPVIGLPDTFSNSFSMRFSYDFEDVTLFLHPVLSYDRKALIEDNVNLSGETGIIFLLDERAITTITAGGGLTIVALHSATSLGRVAVDLSWYPDAPVVAGFSLAAKITDSDVAALDGAEFSLATNLSFSLSDSVLLDVSLPVSLNLFSAEKDWVLELAPKIEAAFDLVKNHTLALILQCSPLFSNNPYYGQGSAELTISYRFDF